MKGRELAPATDSSSSGASTRRQGPRGRPLQSRHWIFLAHGELARIAPPSGDEDCRPPELPGAGVGSRTKCGATEAGFADRDARIARNLAAAVKGRKFRRKGNFFPCRQRGRNGVQVDPCKKNRANCKSRSVSAPAIGSLPASIARRSLRRRWRTARPRKTSRTGG